MLHSMLKQRKLPLMFLRASVKRAKQWIRTGLQLVSDLRSVQSAQRSTSRNRSLHLCSTDCTALMWRCQLMLRDPAMVGRPMR